jgi:hypothetical protein
VYVLAIHRLVTNGIGWLTHRQVDPVRLGRFGIGLELGEERMGINSGNGWASTPFHLPLAPSFNGTEEKTRSDGNSAAGCNLHFEGLFWSQTVGAWVVGVASTTLGCMELQINKTSAGCAELSVVLFL